MVCNEGEEMSEIDQLKKRIEESGTNSVGTARIRYDYDPAGQMMINHLTKSGEYVQRKTPAFNFDQKWRIFKRGFEPY